jgi:ERCC4-type nuclease
MARVVADDRERNGAIPYFDAAIEENNKKYKKLTPAQGGGNITLSIARVTTGDYHVIFDGRVYLSIERKSWQDLAASIKDQRMNRQHRQLEDLSERTGCRTLYIIEGSKRGKGGKIGQIDITTLETKLRRIFLRGSSFEFSKNQQETASIIVHYAREIMRLVASGESIGDELPQLETAEEAVALYNIQLQLLNKRFEKYTKTFGTDFSQHILQPPGTVTTIQVDDDTTPIEEGESQPKDIEELVELHEMEEKEESKKKGGGIKMLQTKHIQTDADIKEAMWCSIKNVSDKTYPLLSAKYSLRDLICADMKTAKTLTAEIADMTYPGGTMKIGESRASAIMIVAYKGKIEKKIEDCKAQSIKLLSQIPGVSEQTAAMILANHTLTDLFSNKVSSSYLCEMERPNGRKLGKLGDVILSHIKNL